MEKEMNTSTLKIRFYIKDMIKMDFINVIFIFLCVELAALLSFPNKWSVVLLTFINILISYFGVYGLRKKRVRLYRNLLKAVVYCKDNLK